MARDGVANIGPRGRRRRRLIGVAGLAGGIAIVAVLVAQDAPHWWRLAAFGPFWLGAVGFLQAKEST